MAYDFDLLTIGGGSGGVAGSRRAASYGVRVGLVENWRMGGTCVMRGCVPKKLLVYGVKFAEAFEDARGFGWSIDGISHDWAAMIKAKDQELSRLEGIYHTMLEKAGVTTLTGRGRLVDAHHVAITAADGSEQVVSAERVLIATGGRPIRPEIPGAEFGISSDEALDLPARPDRVMIVGGGYIGVEFAGIFSTAGAKVTQVLRQDLPLRGFDQELRRALAEAMAARGVHLVPRTVPTAIARTSDGLSVTLSNGSTVNVDQVMFATGRRPNTEGLGLAEAGVALSDSGAVQVDAWQRTSVPTIYAVGDVTDKVQLTPVAIAEARGVAETLYNRNPTMVSHETIATAVFGRPELATVGLSEEAARARYPWVKVFATQFRPMQNILAGRQERTLMKLVVDGASDRVLGAHMIGPDAAEIIQSLAVAVTAGLTKKQFDQTMALHPSAAEEFVTLRDPRPDPS